MLWRRQLQAWRSRRKDRFSLSLMKQTNEMVNKMHKKPVNSDYGYGFGLSGCYFCVI